MKLLPVIEWGCVAGLPILLCTKIVGLPPNRLWSALLSADEATDDDAGGVPSKICDNDIKNEVYLQWTVLILVITSVLSLVATLFFGDAQQTNDNNIIHERGMGVVIGSHLVPIFYLALQLSLLPYGGGSIQLDNNTQRWVYPHLKFASLGGLAFVISCLWSRCNHRKYNCNRRTGQTGYETNGNAINGNGVNKCSATSAEKCNYSAMNLCWKVCISLITISSVCDSVIPSFDFDAFALLLSMLHLLLIMSYDRKTTQSAWQEAFTPGEWMAVSTLLTSLVGEYILDHSGILYNNQVGMASSLYNSLPLHLVVAHAGLVGCIIGCSFCYLLMNSIPISRKFGLAPSLVAVVVITMGCLEVALISRLGKVDTCDHFNPSVTFLCNDWVPRSIQWLFHFLSSKVNVGGTSGILRVAVLGYWACSL